MGFTVINLLKKDEKVNAFSYPLSGYSQPDKNSIKTYAPVLVEIFRFLGF
jgi:hypothetical protein